MIDFLLFIDVLLKYKVEDIFFIIRYIYDLGN